MVCRYGTEACPDDGSCSEELQSGDRNSYQNEIPENLWLGRMWSQFVSHVQRHSIEFSQVLVNVSYLLSGDAKPLAVVMDLQQTAVRGINFGIFEWEKMTSFFFPFHICTENNSAQKFFVVGIGLVSALKFPCDGLGQAKKLKRSSCIYIFSLDSPLLKAYRLGRFHLRYCNWELKQSFHVY